MIKSKKAPDPNGLSPAITRIAVEINEQKKILRIYYKCPEEGGFLIQ